MASRLGGLRQGLSLSVMRTVARQLASLPLATDCDLPVTGDINGEYPDAQADDSDDDSPQG